jgi:predicted O-methyltransferase YrrM
MNTKRTKCIFCQTPLPSHSVLLPDRNNYPCKILVCENCDAVIPIYSGESTCGLTEIEKQIRFHENLWQESPKESLYDLEEDLQVMVRTLRNIIGEPKPDQTILEIGAGRGALVRALKLEGYRVIGCEPSEKLVQQARDVFHLGVEELVQSDAQTFLLDQALAKVKPNVIFIWHVIEHVEKPLEIIKSCFELLPTGGKILIQVPLLASEYLYAEHICFLSSSTINWISNQLKEARCRTWIDTSNLFLSAEIEKHSDYSLNIQHPVIAGAWLFDAMQAMCENRAVSSEMLKKVTKEFETRLRAPQTIQRDNTDKPNNFPCHERHVNESEQSRMPESPLTQKDFTALDDTIKTHARQLNRIAESQSNIEHQLKALAITSAQQENENVTLRQKVASNEVQNQTLRTALSTRQSEIDAATSALKVLQEENAKTHKTLGEETDKALELIFRLQSAENSIKKVTFELEEAENRYNRLLRSFEGEIANSTELRKTASELQHSITQQTDTITQQTDTITQLTDHIRNQDADLAAKNRILNEFNQNKVLKFLEQINIISTPIKREDPTAPPQKQTLPSHLPTRSLNFHERPHNRYWWHRTGRTNYVPLLYSHLNPLEWATMAAWFDDTEKRFKSTGEANVPPLSLLFGLISGNGLNKIVQCGHYVGYSSLMLGFLLRTQSAPQSLFSIDIDPDVTAYTNDWIGRAGLEDHVKLHVGCSANADSVTAALDYLKSKPQLVFIDSSHQYDHTLLEMDVWYEQLTNGGFLVLHDTSLFAASFDASNSGGVLKACAEWCERNNVDRLSINEFVSGGEPGDFPYLDGCGITIIQKRSQSQVSAHQGV